jgi:signal transduction histidine kinase
METNKKHTLLLIDDKTENLIALKSMLVNPQRKIITALSGNEALQILLKEKVSLILVDVQMPEMDGYEFVEIIKDHPDTAHIPTIFVTAISDDPKHLNKAYELGAIDFLYKPLITEITRKKVDSFLKIWDYDQELKSLNEKLQEKNKELEQFAHIIAHDLKTPLGNIKSLIEFIEDEHKLELNNEAHELFDMVKVSAVKMSHLIDDLLYYAKNIQSNEGKENVNISEITDNVIKLLNPSNNVMIKKENLDKNIFFQPIALQQIIQNLISNSIKYNDKENIEIEITFNSSKNCLSLKDNGPGIPENQHKKVFDIFYTLETTTNGESSTGIGLNLVKKLVERNDATIHINELNYEGTEFIISELEII